MKNRIKRLCFNFLLLCGALSSVQAQHFGSAGKQTAVPKDPANGIPYGYYEYLPQNFSGTGSHQKYPVVIFFGGVGELGNGTSDLPKLMNPVAPPRLIKEGKHFPAIVISAQHSGWFDEKQSKELYDYITRRYPVDSARVYVTGLSAGGAATWKFGNAHPDLPAAIVPIAGATNFKSPVPHMQEMAIWAFHNVGDGWTGGGVPSVWSMINVDMVANIGTSSRSVYPGGWAFKKKAGFDVTIHFKDSSYWQSTNGVVKPHQKMAVTIYDQLGHNGWSQTYRNNDMWDWLFAQRKKTTDSVIVNAGNDRQIKLPTAQITLKGSAYSLIGTAISNYIWTKESGPTVTMSGVTTSDLRLTNINAGHYTFKLTATDLNGKQGNDLVELTVKVDPNADAGKDIHITLPQDSTTLDGSNSFDRDGSIHYYDWKLIDSQLAVARPDTDTIITPPGLDTTAYKVFINFTTSWFKAAAPWNNINGSIWKGTYMQNLLDSNGNTTKVELELMSSWNGSKLGGTVTGNNSGVYPDDVINGLYWFQNKTPQIKVSGLDVNKKYNFTFFGSRTGKGLDKTTVYAIGALKDSLNAAENTSQTVTLEDIYADANGEVLIDISRGVNAAYGYLNALVVEAVASSTTADTAIVITYPKSAPSYTSDSTELYVNFTPAYLGAAAPWNNMSGSIAAGTQLKAMKDHTGQPTSVGLELLSYWDGSKTGGKVTGNNGGIYPDDVINGFYWFKGRKPEIKISGLDPEMTYSFTFFGSRTGIGTDKTTVYRIGNQVDSLNATENTSHTVTLTNIHSDANGEVLIEIEQGANAAYGYLNALVIKGKTDGLPIIISDPSKSITNVKGMPEGTFTFELTVTDNDGFVGYDTVDVVVGPSVVLRKKPVVATSEAPEETNEWTVFPNPTQGMLTVSGLSSNEDYRLQVYTALGQEVEIDARRTFDGFKLNLGALPTGYYIVRLNGQLGSKAERVYVAPQ